MDSKWGPWIEHDGKGCPVPNGVITHCVWESGFELIAPVSANGRIEEDNPWIWLDGWPNIIRYRIRKPRALLDLIERARERLTTRRKARSAPPRSRGRWHEAHRS